MIVWNGEPEPWIQRVIDGLEKAGYVVLENALGPEFIHKVNEEIRALQLAGKFQPAQIGKGANLHHDGDIRRDGTFWFRDETVSGLQKEFLRALDSVRMAINSALYLGLWELEGHYAVYAPGAFYRKHVDRFQNDSKRTVSVVAFFNAGWTDEDGGSLSMDTEKGELFVIPEAGTLVFFLSDRISHEVLETNRERLSFAGWFKSRA